MMNKILTLLFIVIATTSINAQYDAALGLKFNHYKGAINYKMFLSDSTNTALDLELGFQETGIEFIGLHNWQVPFSGVKHLYWYYGVGINAGVWDGPVRDISIGIDGQVGVEYVPSEIPIVFSVDFTPNYSLQNSYSKEYDGTHGAEGFGLKTGLLVSNIDLEAIPR